MATTVAIVADTHLPRGARRLPDRCLEICKDADLIIHAGDLMEQSVLASFAELGPPVRAVHGNVDSPDLKTQLPDRLSLKIESARIAVIHDSGPKAGRLVRMKGLFPDHDAVIFGHSHLPLHETDADFQIFNPGSPTERRRSPFKSMGRAVVEGSDIRFELIDLGT